MKFNQKTFFKQTLKNMISSTVLMTMLSASFMVKASNSDNASINNNAPILRSEEMFLEAYNKQGISSVTKERLSALVQAADKGNAAAQVALGMFYVSGMNVPKDTQKGLHYLQLSAAQSNTNAQTLCPSGKLA